MLFAAIENAGSTKAADIVQSLEKLRQMEGAWPVYFRSWDHQMIRRTLILSPRKDITDPLDPLEVKASVPAAPDGLEALYGTKDEIGCALGEI
jgi:branched-chain amino acid transport system substrate-binding protein